MPDAPAAARLGTEATASRRPWFAWNLDEVSGALGDLGTFLPHIIGAITVVGMDPTGILVTFGLFYAFSGAFYGIPMAVQPMKAASAAVLIQPMDPGSVAGAGLVIGAFFLVVGASGLVGRLARALPPTVAAGLQLGLGLSLAMLGIPSRGGAGLVWHHRLRLDARPDALSPTAGRACRRHCGRRFRGGDGHHAITLASRSRPPFTPPGLADMGAGLERRGRAVLPQIPLTLTNAIIVTAAVSRQLFPDSSHQVNERNLSLTTGLANLLAAPFGGYLMCHGAGGISGHFRFGARTATAPVLIGLIFLSLGLLLGQGGYELLRTIPECRVGWVAAVLRN